jgi:hypothetical protein
MYIHQLWKRSKKSKGGQDMNGQTPGYLLPVVLSGTVGTLAAVLFGLQRALKLARWPTPDRRQAVSIATILLVGWFFAALFPSWTGFYRGTDGQIPTIQYGVFIPILVGVALFSRWVTFRRAIDAVPQPWIVGVQLFRLEGAIFLILYAWHGLPGAFAWPAGVGDVIVGLLAPVVGIAYAYNSSRRTGLLGAWNLLGIADLIVAVTTGFLTSPSRFQMLALGSPNVLIGAFPLVMIPVFLVPLAVLLHLASLQKLRQTETESQLSHHVPASERS